MSLRICGLTGQIKEHVQVVAYRDKAKCSEVNKHRELGWPKVSQLQTMAITVDSKFAQTNSYSLFAQNNSI